MAKLTSPIWTCSEEEFKSVVANSKTKREILLYFGLSGEADNYVTLRRRIVKLELDISHLSPVIPKIHPNMTQKTPHNEMFSADSACYRGIVKKRILKENLIPYKCAVCNFSGDWNGKPLVLILDHINGVNNDHRLENLRFLCPNCNAQTDTFCGKQKRRKLIVTKREKKDGSSVERIVIRKFEISKERLEFLIATKPMTEIAKELGVSDNAVKKRAKKLGIELKPMRGYWRKKATGKL